MNRLLRFLAASLLATVAAAVPPDAVPLPDAFGPATGEPSLAHGPDGTAYLTYAGPGRAKGERAVWLATLAPSATAWSPPRPVVSTPLLMENWADFASLTVATDGTLWAQWFQHRPGDDAHGYDGWFARSTDAGATWSAPAPLGHEFVSLAPLGGGRVMAVWLESVRVRDPNAPRVRRDPAAPRPPRDPSQPSPPSMRLAARLLAPDGTALQDWIVDPDVCTCCQTTLATLPGDRLLVAYRGHTPEEIRDNRVARFDGTAWRAPESLHADGWKLPACPVNGPAADTRGESTAIAWFTAAAGVARVQAKLSPDGGATFGPALPIDLGRPIGRIDLVMLADGSALISWLESSESPTEATLYVRRLFPDGVLSAPHRVATTRSTRASGFARMTARPGDDLPVLLAWMDAGPVPAGDTKPATHVCTALLAASAFTRPNGPLVAVTRGSRTEYLELCAPAEHGAAP